jgi:hypothetical protein
MANLIRLENMLNYFNISFNISHINNKINEYVIRNIYFNDIPTDYTYFCSTFMFIIIGYLINNIIYLQKLNRTLWKTNNILADTNDRFSKTNAILGRAAKKITNIKAILKKYTDTETDTDTYTETDDCSKDPDWEP